MMGDWAEKMNDANVSNVILFTRMKNASLYNGQFWAD